MNHSHANSFLFSMILFFAVFHIWFKKLIRNRKSRYIHNQKAFGFRKSSTLSATEWALKESISEKETTLMGPESVYIRKRDDPNGPWKCVYQEKRRPLLALNVCISERGSTHCHSFLTSVREVRWKISSKFNCRDNLYFQTNLYLKYFY